MSGTGMSTSAADEDDLETFFLKHHMGDLPTVLAETGSLHPHARHHEATRIWRLLDEPTRSRLLAAAATAEKQRTLELLVAESEIRRIREAQQSQIAKVLAFVLQAQWLWLAASVVLIAMLAFRVAPEVARTLAISGGIQTVVALLLLADTQKTGQEQIQRLLGLWPVLPMLLAAVLAILL